MKTIGDPGRLASEEAGGSESEPRAPDETPDTRGREWDQLARLPVAPPKVLSQWRVAIIVAFAAAAVRLVFLQALGTRTPFITFFPAVMLAALYGGLGAGLLAAALSSAVVTYFWIEPARNFSNAQPADWLSMAVFLLSCAMICVMAEMLHRARSRAHGAELKAHAALISQQHLERLRESEERHRALFDHNLDAVLLSHQPEGKIIAANPAACAMFGVTEEELCRMGVGIIDPEEPRLASALEERTRTGKFRGELTHIRKDGTKFSADISSVILPGGRDSFVIIRDIAERKLFEKQLLEAEKLEAIGRLAGGVAHDLNNMMAAVILNADIIQSQLSSDHSLGERVGDMRDAAEHSAELTRQLLAFSRKQVLCPKVVELNDLIAKVSTMLARVGGENIDLVLSLSDNLDLVKADPTQIKQVIRSLASNARDAMSKGGTLTIATTNVEFGQGYQTTHGPVPPGRYVMISVSDTGTGMKEETRSHLFEPFFTTKAFGKGSGLGLAIVYGIVKQSGGHIWVRSEEGQGTTFEICLPVIDVAKGMEAQPEPVTVPATASATILLVEDELILLKLFRTVLEAEGYSVLTASSGEEALELARIHQGKIDLLLTDVILGGRMNGFELSSQLCTREAGSKEAGPIEAGLKASGMKVIHMTGYSDVTHIEGAGVVADMTLLGKPINAAMLRRSVREKLAGKAL